MANTILQYMAEVERRLCTTIDDRALQAVLQETEAHLRESAAEIQTLGFGRYEAEQRAVAAFGEAAEYGKALAAVEPQAGWVAPKNLVLHLAFLATACVVLQPLMVEEYRWDRCFSMAPALTVAAFVFIAAMLGSRVSTKKLCLLAAAGGLALLPILAVRFVVRDGFVVKSLWVRDMAIQGAAFNSEMAKRFLVERQSLDKLEERALSGKLPASGIIGTDGDLSNLSGDHDWPLYFAPRLPSDGSRSFGWGLSAASEVLRYSSGTEIPIVTLQPQDSDIGVLALKPEAEALKAWREETPELREHFVKAYESHALSAAETKRHLDESFVARAVSMSSCALLIAILWGALLVSLQALGIRARGLLLAAARFLLGERSGLRC